MMNQVINTPLLSWTTIDKSSWGNGPWQTEPDKAQWQDEETGLPCLAVRNESLGHWCGYVGVHLESKLAQTNREDYEVHGGVTFQGKCQEPEADPDFDGSKGICHRALDGRPVMWFGFDCAHSGDYSPGLEAFWIDRGVPSLSKFERYRTLDYVKSEIKDLARQIKADLDNE
jgi:hypothetical protein